jgi:hypothetical protein
LSESTTSLAPTDASSRCELCAVPIGEQHSHLAEPARGSIACACPDCARLFDFEGLGRYRRVPDEVCSLTTVGFEAQDWAALGIPIGLAWLRRTDAGEIRASFPSPIGTAETTLEPEALDLLERLVPRGSLRAEVEALLIHRLGTETEAWRVPIDICYMLVGTLRAHWIGLTGGSAAQYAVREFLARLRERAGAPQ